MSRRTKLILGVLLAVPLLGLAAIFVILPQIDLASRVAARGTAALGRSLTIDSLRLSPGLRTTVEIRGARLANIEGGSAPHMATLASATATLDLLPLLRGQVVLHEVRAEGFTLLLERDGCCGTDASGAAASADDASRRMQEHGTTNAPCPLRTGNVLLVEDNVINQEIALALLEREGLTVTCAADGVEALDTVRKQRFAIIFMDLQMPVMDGLEATRRIRALGAGPNSSASESGDHAWLATVPVVAMTANVMADDRQRCLDAGMNDHLGKPIDPEQLDTCLRRWLA